jgi:transcription-repair coupling factor (superfamily II helicase)
LPERDASVEIPVDAYIPESYISEEETRVEEYRRLVVAGRAGAVDEFASELVDRFGEPPLPVRQLLALERLRAGAAKAGLESVTMRGDELQLKGRSGQEDILVRAALFAAENDYCANKGLYADQERGTLYIKLRLGEVNNRQELLLMWLKSIIDDILIVQGAPGEC